MAVLGLIGAGYVEDIPRNSFYAYAADIIIFVLFGTAFTFRRLFPKSRLSLEYAKRFYAVIQWLIAAVIVVLSPIVLTFTPYLTIAGIVPKLAIAIVIIIWLSSVGIWFNLSDSFKEKEEGMVARYEKLIAAPDYDAILRAEEFEHLAVQSKSPITHKKTLRKRVMKAVRRSA